MRPFHSAHIISTLNIEMARSNRKMMADVRAMEEEAERTNPIHPTGATPTMGVSQIRGGGATPSMGLSQFRGGGTKKGQMRKTARRAYEGGALPIAGGEMPMGGMYGCGKGEESESDVEEEIAKNGGAYGMGRHLGTHLHSLHGSGFFDDFKQGFMSVVSPVANIAKSLLPLAGPEGAAASAVMGAIGLGKRGRRKGAGLLGPGGTRQVGAGLLGPGGTRQVGAGAYGNEDVPAGAKFSSRLNGGVRTGAYEGKGKLVIKHLPEGDGTEIHEGSGRADGRRARAAVVKRVMRERGVSMIEASKIVKREGLYGGGGANA